jgi:hypothetical protein
MVAVPVILSGYVSKWHKQETTPQFSSENVIQIDKYEVGPSCFGQELNFIGSKYSPDALLNRRFHKISLVQENSCTQLRVELVQPE